MPKARSPASQHTIAILMFFIMENLLHSINTKCQGSALTWVDMCLSAARQAQKSISEYHQKSPRRVWSLVRIFTAIWRTG